VIIVLLTIFINLYFIHFALFALRGRNAIHGQMTEGQMKCPNPFCASPIKDKYHSGQSSSFFILSCDINVNLISLPNFFDATIFCFEN